MIPSTPKAPHHRRVAGWKSSKASKFFQDDWFVAHLNRQTGTTVLPQKDEFLPLSLGSWFSPWKVIEWFCNRWITFWIQAKESSIHETFSLKCPKWAGSAVALNHKHCHKNWWSQNSQRNMYSSGGWNRMVAWFVRMVESQYTRIFLKYTQKI